MTTGVGYGLKLERKTPTPTPDPTEVSYLNPRARIALALFPHVMRSHRIGSFSPRDVETVDVNAAHIFSLPLLASILSAEPLITLTP